MLACRLHIISVSAYRSHFILLVLLPTFRMHFIYMKRLAPQFMTTSPADSALDKE